MMQYINTYFIFPIYIFLFCGYVYSQTYPMRYDGYNYQELPFEHPTQTTWSTNALFIFHPRSEDRRENNYSN